MAIQQPNGHEQDLRDGEVSLFSLLHQLERLVRRSCATAYANSLFYKNFISPRFV